MDDLKYQIYVLKISPDKYYVGKSYNILDTRIFESSKFNELCEWLKIHKHREIISVTDHIDEFDYDKMTIQMMGKYGINNVRGGSFNNNILDDHEIKIISKMIENSKSKNISENIKENEEQHLLTMMCHVLANSQVMDTQTTIKYMMYEYQSADGKSLFSLACKSQPYFAEYILNSVYMNNDMLRCCDISGQTPFMIATLYCQEIAIKILESKFMSTELLRHIDNDGYTVFMLACHFYPELARRILESKYMIHDLLYDRDLSHNLSPLMLACINQPEVVKYISKSQFMCPELLKMYDNPTHNTPLILVCKDHPEALKYILESKYMTEDLLFAKNIEEFTPMMEASEHNSECVKIILESQFASTKLLSEKDKFGWTALLVASYSNAESVREILESKHMTNEIFNQRSIKGKSSLDLACYYNNHLAVKYLLESKYIDPKMLQLGLTSKGNIFLIAWNKKNTQSIEQILIYMCKNKIDMKYELTCAGPEIEKILLNLIIENKISLEQIEYSHRIEINWKILTNLVNLNSVDTFNEKIKDICQICFENNVDIYLKCQHLICSDCFSRIRHKLCPTCKYPMTSYIKFKRDENRIVLCCHE